MKRAYVTVVFAVLIAISILIMQPMAQGQAASGAPPAQKRVPRNLAILIFEGVQIIDYTGPYETFGHAYSKDGEVFNIYTVSEKANPITTAMGMTVTPKYSFENAPPPNVLVVPGGGVEEHVA
ncbi:MAG: DJ-1/PfpI family protein, partial [Pyrinomonadaceae bacterium]|nr:DJ-1/PfpI family protein [Pyrinomonadaceae bacterium]